MNLKYSILLVLSALLAGCLAPPHYAEISDDLIRNPSLDIAYKIPEEIALYRPGDESPSTPLRQMALRIYNLNNNYHPSGNETFYESFLMFSDQTAFLLITVQRTNKMPADRDWMDNAMDDEVDAKELMPLYNAEETTAITLNDGRTRAQLTKGTAFENKGWYYSRSKPGRTAFNYEACKMNGPGLDSYILMGFSTPENRHILSTQMQEMLRGFRWQ